MDDIDTFPVDDENPSAPQELAILQKYFTQQSTGEKSDFGVKEAVYATLLFILMANPAIDLCLDYVPHTGSPLIKIGIKAIIYFIFVYLIFIKSC